MTVRWLALALVLLGALSARAWNVRCEVEEDEKCQNGYESAQTPWRAHPQAEHRALLDLTLSLAQLPAELRDEFTLTVFTSGADLPGSPLNPPGSLTSIRPVLVGANGERTRVVSVPAMANLPDFSYALWDWASGNETCPPDPSNPSAFDCHNYETHIGWLNSNHMLPQAQRFYAHLHALALERARNCRAMHEEIVPDQRDRFTPYVRACEREALVIEGVAQHYLQDAWASGHMWERWGGPEIGDFGGDRTLGFAIAAFVGTIHGAGAMLGPGNDDPLCGPFEGVEYVETFTPDTPAGTARRSAVGDVYLQSFLLADDVYEPQRRALLGCAVDGVREVYAETAQLHGEMGAPGPEIDTRDVNDVLDCWRQRVTNRALAAGCGIHTGTFPEQNLVVGGNDISGALQFALAYVEYSGVDPLGLPELDTEALAAFRRDAADACSRAAFRAAEPGGAEDTDLARGGFPPLAGVQPNSCYARGGLPDPGLPAECPGRTTTPGALPASWADPPLPWDVGEVGSPREALALTFADAHAADRCRTMTASQLETYRVLVGAAKVEGDPKVVRARCGQCVQMTAPHLRFGVAGQYDERREAFCAFQTAGSVAFVYTDEDPTTFTGDEPNDLNAVLAAARTRCHCDDEPTTTTVTTPTTSTSLTTTTLQCDPDRCLAPGPSGGCELQCDPTNCETCVNGTCVGCDRGGCEFCNYNFGQYFCVDGCSFEGAECIFYPGGRFGREISGCCGEGAQFCLIGRDDPEFPFTGQCCSTSVDCCALMRNTFPEATSISCC